MTAQGSQSTRVASPSAKVEPSSSLEDEARLAERRTKADKIQGQAADAADRKVKGEAPEIVAAEVAAQEDAENLPQRRSFFAEIAMLARGLMVGAHRWPIIKLASGLLVVVVANMLSTVRLNSWNGTFFDAVEKKDIHAFEWQLVVFLMIAGVLLMIVVAQTWLQEMLKVRLREGLTNTLLDRWLAPNRAYQLGFAGDAGGAPDQRMQEDTRLVAESTAELGVGMLNALLLLVSFVGVLWGLSSQVTFTINGKIVDIPGYMVWVAVGYAAIGTGLTWLVGRKLIGLNTERYAREAELRFALVRVNESAESVALYRGEEDERRHLNGMLEAVLTAMRGVSRALSRLTWITSGYGWLAIVVPILAAVPGYFGGQLTFGGLMMVVGAFTQVQGSLRYFVDNFARLADWRSATHRLATFQEAVEALDEVEANSGRINLEPHPEGKLAFEGLSVSLNDGEVVIEEANAEVSPGERVLIKGESGSGKSTLFRALAGIWVWGSGTIKLPPREEMMFMPQRPYLPLGTLSAALCYPQSPDTFDAEAIQAALERCGLGELAGDLEKEERWDKALSLGQQQRVAFARLLLHRPKWVFMDEATAALDEASQNDLLGLCSEGELEGTTVLSIGHRPGLEAFHTRTLQLQKTPTGAVLFGRRQRAAQRIAPWRARLRQWRGRSPMLP